MLGHIYKARRIRGRNWVYGYLTYERFFENSPLTTEYCYCIREFNGDFGIHEIDPNTLEEVKYEEIP